MADPKTVAWLGNNVDNIFGFPNIARFSWQTVKTMLMQKAVKVKWCVVHIHELSKRITTEQILLAGMMSPRRSRSTLAVCHRDRRNHRCGKTSL